MTTSEQAPAVKEPAKGTVKEPVKGAARPRHAAADKIGRQDWSSWPHYDNAASGFRGYWYPVTWSTHITEKPLPFT
ncbi:aromatic ring-hydroxylating dioxygenase subunit alpha, partial [Streptomyces sp. NPDC056728]